MSLENTQYVSYMVELAQQGRKNAFFDLCGINLRNIFTIVNRLLIDFELSKKVTIAIFLTAWDNIKLYNPKLSFALWMKDLAVKYSIRELEKRGELGISNKNIAASVLNIEHLITALPNEERLIFVLHDLEGYNYYEITSFLTHLSVDEVKTKLITTRENLMKQIEL